ncbi:MAG TPA: M48 family metallopeptidase, partial [Planctomycetota bacterium]|nr:M48 family metallopeptidase [Planctomycetota bacterium]
TSSILALPVALFLCAAPAVFLPSCAVDPITGRSSLHLLPDDQVDQMGAQAFQQILQESEGAVLPPESPEAQLVRRVGARIAAVVDQQLIESGREPFDWEFVVIESDQVNAFALPGGKVAFYTGILPVAANETGIAVVMGHEVAHAYGRHANSRLSMNVIAKYGLGAVQHALSGGGDSMVNQLTLAALGVGTQVGMLGFSREDEAHADELGLIFMARAGYDPREAIAFWERMEAAAGGSGGLPEFLSTHPGPESRIRNLNETLPRALDEYRKAASATGGNAAVSRSGGAK